MGVLVTLSTILFVIVCFLLIIIILLQSDKGAGMGILGGSSQSAFGSSTVDVITKATGVLVALFLIGSFGLAALSSSKANVRKKGLNMDTQEQSVPKGKLAPEKSDSADKGKKPAPGETK